MTRQLRDVRLCQNVLRLVIDNSQQITRDGLPKTLGSLSWRRSYSSTPDDGSNVDFGFRQVPRDAKAGLVGQVFSSVASSYDIMNDLMSGGLHRLWKDRLVESLRPFPGQEHLDVAGGTGDVAFRVLRAIRAAEVEERMAAAAAGRTSTGGRGRAAAAAAAAVAPSPQQGAAAPAAGPPGPSNVVPEPGAGPESSATGGSAAAAAAAAHDGTPSGGSSSSSSSGSGGGGGGGQAKRGGARPLVPTTGRVVVCDINPDMLRVGQQKAAATVDLAGDLGLSFVEGNAEVLPFPSDSFDSYTIAFGIRNVTDRPAALREALRVLKPGGRFMCLEFSQVTQPGLRELYDMYSFAVIPRIGGLVANDAASYQYLVESIRKFPDQETFARMVEEAGFRAVTYENLTAGVVALHSGFKL